MTLFMSRIRMSDSPAIKALAGLLLPSNMEQKLSAQHNILWAAFSDGPDRNRDFLFREERDGSFLTLSSRRPVQNDIFLPHQVKEYAPVIANGQLLDFRMRVNATKTNAATGKREDIVKSRIDAIPHEQRAGARLENASYAGQEWLKREGERHGFSVLSAAAEDYSIRNVARVGQGSGRPMCLGVIDMVGTISVTNPELLISKMALGFGRAKAFGYGLMMIRRSIDASIED